MDYKFLTQFVTGIISRKQMEEELCIAIFQFAKRQMTWFRGMERRGIQIHWINGELEMEKRVEEVLLILNA